MSISNVKCGYFIIFLTPLFLLPTGFWHEQSRADRDKNVEIVWNNINPAMKYNFMKYTLTQIQHLNAPYDTCSVMHYSGTAFSRVNIDKRKFSPIEDFFCAVIYLWLNTTLSTDLCHWELKRSKCGLISVRSFSNSIRNTNYKSASD